MCRLCWAVFLYALLGSLCHREETKKPVVGAGRDLEQCEENGREESCEETYLPAKDVGNQTEEKHRFHPKSPEDKHAKDETDLPKEMNFLHTRGILANPVVFRHKRLHSTLALVVFPFGASKIYSFVLKYFLWKTEEN